MDRLPPHSEESEAGVLGCLFLSPQEAIPEAMELFGAIRQPFYLVKNQNVWEVICDMFTASKKIDVVTVMEELKLRGKLGDAGGLTYLAELPDKAPSAYNLSAYADVVKEKYVLRSFLGFFSKAEQKIWDYSGGLESLVDSFGKEVSDLTELRISAGDDVPMREWVRRAVDMMEAKASAGGLPTGLKTGLIDLDRWTMGLHPGQLIVVAARPSCGKSTLAMNIVEEVALDTKGHCAVFSLEMTGEELCERSLYSRARVDGRKMSRDGVEMHEAKKLAAVAAQLAAANIHITDKAGLNILQIKAKARKLHRKHKLSLIVVDYLQLVTPLPHKGQKNRSQEVGEVSAGLKELAKELNIPIILISQLNRESDKEKNRRPRLSDLRESGAIEQDADVCIFIWDKNVPEGTEATKPREVILYIAKQRNGPRGAEIPVFFNNTITRFENLSRVIL